MTDQEICIAIAEKCGYTNGVTHDRISWNCPDGMLVYELPDYPNDLNAMHEAEKLLFTHDNWEACKYDELIYKATSSWKWSATARQRSKAFLKVFGLWK